MDMHHDVRAANVFVRESVPERLDGRMLLHVVLSRTP